MSGYTVYCHACGNVGCDFCSGARVQMIQQAALNAHAQRVRELVDSFLREHGIGFQDQAQAMQARDLIGRAIAYGIRHAEPPKPAVATEHEGQVPVSRFDHIEWE